MVKAADTIFALSSGSPPSGVAVIRLSGPDAFGAISALVGDLPPARRAALRTIRTRNGDRLDAGLILLFPGPASFTGEDCAELQIHGGKAVIAAIFSELTSLPNCRMAENGEFSRRALDNGKLDLLEVEGLADLLSAETEMQRRLAIEQSSGGLSQLYRDWAVRLTRDRALIEAELDFSDEGDVPGSVSDQIWADVSALREDLAAHLDGARFGEIVRDGLKVAISGPPNSGKSSLLNALARRDVAIVTEVAGTTRDILEVHLDIAGFSVRLFDTAGIRETADIVEVEGIRRAKQTVEAADIVLLLTEAGTPAPDIQIPSEIQHWLLIGTKSDLASRQAGYDILISTVTGEGLDELRQMLAGELEKRADGMSMAVPARERHRLLLEETHASVLLALEDNAAGLDIRAEHLRAAAQSLGRITGHVDVEDLLEVIFSQFCIGK